jgi:tRNA-specific 2-thiouridylase
MFSAVAKPFLSPSPPLFRLPLSSISISFRVFPSFFSSSSSSQLPSPQSSNPITPLISSNRNYSRHAFIVDQYLSCSMPEKPLRVAVLLSGGVDSSVALRLLHAAGHSCTAFYLKIWFQEGFENFWNQCPWEDDLKYAKHVCEQVDVPLEVVHLTDEYWERVVSSFFVASF